MGTVLETLPILIFVYPAFGVARRIIFTDWKAKLPKMQVYRGDVGNNNVLYKEFAEKSLSLPRL